MLLYIQKPGCCWQFISVTGAIWKVSSDVENVDRLEDLGIMQILVKLLAENTSSMDDLQFNAIQVDVLTNVVGCLSEVLKIQVGLSFIDIC